MYVGRIVGACAQECDHACARQVRVVICQLSATDLFRQLESFVFAHAQGYRMRKGPARKDEMNCGGRTSKPAANRPQSRGVTVTVLAQPLAVSGTNAGGDSSVNVVQSVSS